MELENKYLEKLREEVTLVDIYTDHFNESFYGFIKKINDQYLLLEHYNDNLEYNGVVVFRREDITRIKWGGNDLHSAQVILNSSLKSHQIQDINISDLKAILTSIFSIYKYITINVQNVDDDLLIIGEIEDIDDSTVVIKQFGTKSTLDRTFLMINLDDITRVDAGGIYESGLMKLNYK